MSSKNAKGNGDKDKSSPNGQGDPKRLDKTVDPPPHPDQGPGAVN